MIIGVLSIKERTFQTFYAAAQTNSDFISRRSNLNFSTDPTNLRLGSEVAGVVGNIGKFDI
jgi:hypothetical protein